MSSISNLGRNDQAELSKLIPYLSLKTPAARSVYGASEIQTALLGKVGARIQ